MPICCNGTVSHLTKLSRRRQWSSRILPGDKPSTIRFDQRFNPLVKSFIWLSTTTQQGRPATTSRIFLIRTFFTINSLGPHINTSLKRKQIYWLDWLPCRKWLAMTSSIEFYVAQLWCLTVSISDCSLVERAGDDDVCRSFLLERCLPRVSLSPFLGYLSLLMSTSRCWILYSIVSHDIFLLSITRAVSNSSAYLKHPMQFWWYWYGHICIMFSWW